MGVDICCGEHRSPRSFVFCKGSLLAAQVEALLRLRMTV